MLGLKKIIKRYYSTSLIIGLMLFFYLLDVFFIYLFPENLIYRHTILSVNTSNPSFIDILLTSFMQNNSYHLFRNMILVAIFGPLIEDKIGAINSMGLFIFSASSGLVLYVLHFQLFRTVDSVVRGSSGATIAFAGIGISIIINNFTNINWLISSIIALVIVTHIELMKVILDPSIVSSAYPVMTAHVGGLVFGYIFIVLISYIQKNSFNNNNGRYDKI